MDVVGGGLAGTCLGRATGATATIDDDDISLVQLVGSLRNDCESTSAAVAAAGSHRDVPLRGQKSAAPIRQTHRVAIASRQKCHVQLSSAL